ncbi:MAG: hypothetical protein ACFFCU_20400, partial [Promethearchaeota archaeon]
MKFTGLLFIVNSYGKFPAKWIDVEFVNFYQLYQSSAHCAQIIDFDQLFQRIGEMMVDQTLNP